MAAHLIFFAFMYFIFAGLRSAGDLGRGGNDKFKGIGLVCISERLVKVLFLSREQKKQPLWLVLAQILNLLSLPFLPWRANFHHTEILLRYQFAVFFGTCIFMVVDSCVAAWRDTHGPVYHYDPNWREKKK